MSKPKKESFSDARESGTIIDWGIRFWLPNQRKLRWSEGPKAFIRNASIAIMEQDKVIWTATGNGAQFVAIQSILNTLSPGVTYELQLEIPAGDPYASSVPAGPHSGRQAYDELPPLDRFDIWDYQLRPGKLEFRVAEAGPKAPVKTNLHFISEISEPSHDKNHRPTVVRGRLVPSPKLQINHLEIDWRPDWLRKARARPPDGGDLVMNITPRNSYSYIGGGPTHIVLHQTGGDKDKTDAPASIGGAIAQLTDSWDKQKPHWRGIHYLVDYDGHVVKMAPNSVATGHAGGSEWRSGGMSMNNLAIGIEHVHHEEDTLFPPEQTAASVNLVSSLVAHFGIDPRCVVGHGEVRIIRTDKADELAEIRSYTNKHYKKEYDPAWGKALHPHDRLTSCPGGQFDWSAHAKAGSIPDVFNAPLPAAWVSSAIAKFLTPVKDRKPNGPLRRDDGVFSDKQIRLGGDDQPETMLDAATEIMTWLHEKLRTVGYSIPKASYNRQDRTFEWPLQLAVMTFQHKFTSFRGKDAGKVDLVTAQMIATAAEIYK